MEKISDYVEFQDTDKQAEYLRTTAQSFDVEAGRIWKMTQLGDACRVLPNILRSIARQLRLLAESAALPIEVAAGGCRTIYEINIRLRIVLLSDANMKEFQVERVYDEIDFLKSFKGLSNSGPTSPTLVPINDRIDELNHFASKHGLKKPSKYIVKEGAKLAGVVTEHENLYGFYSKYVHGSAWLVNASDAERDGDGYRNIFIIQAQKYALDALGRVSDYVKTKTSD